MPRQRRPDLRAGGRRYRRRQPHGRPDQAAGAGDRAAGRGRRNRRLRRAVRPQDAPASRTRCWSAATDGVGTKVKIAIETGRHDTIGIDLVAMSVNDLVVQGAEPLFFLDYFATGKLEPRCRRRGGQGRRDRLQGSGLRADRRRDRRDARPLLDRRLRPRGLRGRRGRARPDPAARDVAAGDVVLGLASSGVALERLFAGRARWWSVSGLALGRARAVRCRAHRSAKPCSTPTRIYVKSCLAAIRETSGVKALAHITGGGFPDNIPRVLPEGLGVRVDLRKVAGAAGVPVAGQGRRHRRARNAAHVQLRRRHDRWWSTPRQGRRGRRRCLTRNGEAVRRLGTGGAREGRRARRVLRAPQARVDDAQAGRDPDLRGAARTWRR